MAETDPETRWARSTQGQAAVMAACRTADDLGLARTCSRPAVVLEPAHLASIVYAAALAAGWITESRAGLWIVAKPEGRRPSGHYELPMFATYFDEAEARAEASKAKAVLAELPVIADYRD